ncbi:MAG: hypothetical protein RIC55_27730 [Pirellulaceae bacterium]
MKTTSIWAGKLGLMLATVFALGVTRLAAEELPPPAESSAGKSSAVEATPKAVEWKTAEIVGPPAVEQGAPVLNRLPYIARLFKNAGVGRCCEVDASGETNCGDCVLGKIPYLSRLFKNSGAVRVHAIEVEHNKAGDGQSLQVYSIRPRESTNENGRLGVDFEFVVDEKTQCAPYGTQAVAVGQAAGCAVGECKTNSAPGVCADACNEVCTPAVSCDANQCATTGCACGAGCKCCEAPTTVAGPIRWFQAAAPGVRLPSVFGGHGITFRAETVAAPHGPAGVPIPHVHPRGCPFKALHERLVLAESQKAALAARLEARERQTEQLLTLAAENGKLQATVDLAGEILELKDEHAREQRELVERILQGRSEQLEMVAELTVEKAKLEAKLELTEARQELVGELLEAQVEMAKNQAVLEVQASAIKEKLEAFEQLRAENEKLKNELAGVRHRPNGPYLSYPHSYAAPPHTATLPAESRAEESATEK